MLYKLNVARDKTTFVRLNPTTMQAQGLLESQMEQWLADNPTAVLPEDESRVLVIFQETPFKNVTDILAVDSDANLVIIEVKRGQSPRDVIAQALEYSSDVADWDYNRLNRTAVTYFVRRNLSFNSLIEAYSDTFGIPLVECSEARFNEQQRVFIVGESIDEKIERTARWLLKRGVPITCMNYVCYLSDDESREIFLDMNEVVRPSELLGGGHPVALASPPPTETEAVDCLPADLKKVYTSLRESVLRFGDDVQTYATQHNFIFKAGRVFAEIPQVRRVRSL